MFLLLDLCLLSSCCASSISMQVAGLAKPNLHHGGTETRRRTSGLPFRLRRCRAITAMPAISSDPRLSSFISGKFSDPRSSPRLRASVVRFLLFQFRRFWQFRGPRQARFWLAGVEVRRFWQSLPIRVYPRSSAVRFCFSDSGDVARSRRCRRSLPNHIPTVTSCTLKACYNLTILSPIELFLAFVGNHS